MRLSYLRLSGFRGVRGTIELVLPAGFVVISGPNGSGKSTLCDAFEFALTGRLASYLYDTDKGDKPRTDKITEKGETIEDYIWWRGTGHTDAPSQVSFNIVDDDGEEHVFARGRNGFEVGSEEDLKSLLCSTPREGLQDLVEVFRTSLFRDEQITRLSVDLSEADRFAFVRSAVGFGGLSTIESKVQATVTLLRHRAANLKTEYAMVREQVAALTSQVSELRSRAVQGQDTAKAEAVIREALTAVEGPASADDGSLLLRGQRLVVSLRAELDKIVRLSRELDAVESRRAEIETAFFKEEQSQLEARAVVLSDQLQFVGEENSALVVRLEAFQSTESLAASQAQLAEHGTRVGLADGRCPLCGSIVSAASFESHLADLRQHVDSSASTLRDLTRRQGELAEAERRLRRDLEGVRQRLSAMSGAAELVTQRRESLIEEAKAVVGDTTAQPEELLGRALARLRGEISLIERSLTVLETSRAYNEATDLERQLEVVKQRSDLFSRQLSRAQAAEERALNMDRAVRRVSGELVDEQVSALNPLLGELYARLRPHVEWQNIRYRMRGDVRRFLSLEVGDGLNPRFLFSSGQRRAMGIAFLLAVYKSRPWCRLRTLILDDPVQHVDDFRALHLAEVLSAIRAGGEQIICTVEDAALADLLCRRLRSTESQEGLLVQTEYKPGDGVRIESTRSVAPLPRALLKLA